MQIGVVGISYKSAELSLREAVSRALQAVTVPSDGVLLATCNRTELYFSSKDLAETQSNLLAKLNRELCGSFDQALYSFFGLECFSHLAAVTSGLDSAILGESDIQRQVKLAYQSAQTPPSSLHFLFQKSLKLAKKVRSSFASPMSLEGVVLHLVKSFFARGVSVFFLGYSEVNRKIASRLRRDGVLTRGAICTRNPQLAQGFALDHALSLVPREELVKWGDFDLVIGASSCEAPLITEVLPQTKTRLILDLSLPRCVHPDLQRNPTLTLLNMEEIGKLVESERISKESESLQARALLRQEAARQIALYHAKVGAFR